MMPRTDTTDAMEFVRDFIHAALPLLEPNNTRFEASWRRLSMKLADNHGGEESDPKQLSFTLTLRPFIRITGNGWISKATEDNDWLMASLVFQYRKEAAWKVSGIRRERDKREFIILETVPVKIPVG